MPISPTDCIYIWDGTGMVKQAACDDPRSGGYEWDGDEWDSVQSAMDLYLADAQALAVNELIELWTVQGAMNIFIADTDAMRVAFNTIAISDFATSDPALSPFYLVKNPTDCTYIWTADGVVSQVACDRIGQQPNAR